MKKIAQRTPVSRTDKLAMGMAASSGAIVTAVCAARDMGGPILATAVGVGLAALAAIVLFVFRDRSPAPEAETPAEQDGAVEALAAL
ncbi:hypothetical protein [Caulobacter sp. X]|uniref:hypothetical protein n=1 Tax=Caulobacter sp. X TaxID=2048901 RepID=UPI000C1541DA|nr:hypothetical protein [Caulobacter sp. X]PIC00834.1 hypothetical protein CSW60_04580 [Caulobacter sp. X]